MKFLDLLEMKPNRREKGALLAIPENQACRDPIHVLEQARICRIVDIAFRNGRVGADIKERKE